MSKQVISQVEGATPPLPVFSHAVISNGHVYVSGSIGSDAEHNIIGGVEMQAVAALHNMCMILQGAGSGIDHIVKVTVYLTNMARDFDLFNEVYARYFDGVSLPARTCIGVAALPMGAFVEIECIAQVTRADDE